MSSVVKVVRLDARAGRRDANANRRRALVAGGAGFLGSHLCERLLLNGYEVVVLDNFHTGKRHNLNAMQRDPFFTCIKHDIVDALPTDLAVDEIYNLACPASPPHYQADPIHTMLTSVVGTLRLLERARNDGARFLQASTSAVYGDPLVHTQPEAYWGTVNPTGPRARYDEGTSAAETLAWRGTPAGLRRFLELTSGGPATVTDGGGIWREGESPAFTAWVRMTVESTGWMAEQDFVALVRDEVPAHVYAELTVNGRVVWRSDTEDQ